MDTNETPSHLIADMDASERPREKALALGIKALTDAELMALIFSTGVKGKSVIQLCREILDDNDGHISLVAEIDTREFMRRYSGIGPAKALTLLAALELGHRSVADAVAVQSRVINSSAVAAKYMYRFLSGLDHEEFWVLMLRRNLTVLRQMRIGQGGMTGTVVDVKVLAREVLLSKASAIMVFHNHPSGNLKPSIQDEKLTKKIGDAMSLIDVSLLDHIILGNGISPESAEGFYSFHDNGKMP